MKAPYTSRPLLSLAELVKLRALTDSAPNVIVRVTLDNATPWAAPTFRAPAPEELGPPLAWALYDEAGTRRASSYATTAKHAENEVKRLAKALRLDGTYTLVYVPGGDVEAFPAVREARP